METYLYREMYELENKHWWYLAKREIVQSLAKEFLPQKSGNTILDVGCGSGLMLNAFDELGTVYGMDCSSEAIQFSKRVFDGDLRLGVLPNAVSYANESFHMILALDVLEHIEQDAAAMEKLHALLKKGGICIVAVPAHQILWSRHDAVNGHFRRYRKKELVDKLEQAGFRILKLSYYNTFLFLPILLFRLVKKTLRCGRDSDAKMPNKATNRILYRIFSYEKIFLKRFDFCFGVSLIAVVAPAEPA